MTREIDPIARKQLRVAIVATSLKRGGAEKQTFYAARALFEAGTDLRVFYLGEGGHYEKVLRAAGIPVRQIFWPNRPLVMLLRLAAAFLRFRPDLVYAPQFGDLIYAGLAGKCCNSLTLGGLRSNGHYELDEAGRRGPLLVRLAHGLIANSRGARDNFARRGFDVSKIRILPNVVDLEAFDAASADPPVADPPPGSVAAVAAGRLESNKRFDRFLSALASARLKSPALFGILAGADYGAAAALVQQAQALGLLPGRIMFTGECANVAALLRASDILVLCSDYEGFPNVILEAMAAGLPVVTTRVGEAERIIRHQDNGYLIERPDSPELSDRMATLACDAPLRRRLGQRGRECVSQQYSYQILPARIIRLLADFAAQNQRAHLKAALESVLADGSGSRACSYGLARFAAGCTAQPS